MYVSAWRATEMNGCDHPRRKYFSTRMGAHPRRKYFRRGWNHHVRRGWAVDIYCPIHPRRRRRSLCGPVLQYRSARARRTSMYVHMYLGVMFSYFAKLMQSRARILILGWVIGSYRDISDVVFGAIRHEVVLRRTNEKLRASYSAHTYIHRYVPLYQNLYQA